jgi:hypothetical protein
MAYRVAEEQKLFFLLRKLVNVNITYNVLDLHTRQLIKVRSETLTAELLKIQVI